MDPQAVHVRVWDLPTRLFHWVLMACVIGSVISAKLRYLKGRSRADEHHEIASSGPLVRFVWGATGSALTSRHKGDGQWRILTLVALHVAAIVIYRVRLRRDLVTPMITDDLPRRALALLLLAACGAGVAWRVGLGA